ncbi:restriction endonuclease subunit S [Halovenus halobia]|uniref:restriction endonuclease subunit S n=1 Tax=Halovenus halobia TaxID=3396622 RepID=UPI003F5506D6
MSEDATLDDFIGTAEEGESEEDSVRELFGLGEIPADWSIEALADISEIIPGNSPPSSTYNEEGEGLPFFQGNSEFGHFYPEADTWCSEPRKEAEKNDVLMSIRAPVGDLNIADTNCCIGRGIAALRPKTLNGLYLFYNLAERKPWLSRLATGSTFNSVTKSDLQLLDIPVPTLKEQRKIATVLHNVDQAIQKTKEIIEQVERVQDGVLNDLFTRGIDESGRVRPSPEVDAESYKEERRYTIPSDWRVSTLQDLCAEKITYGIVQAGPHIDNGVPYIKTGDITNGELEIEELSRTSEEITEDYNRSRLQSGELVVTIRATVGVVVQVPPELEGANLTQGTARVSPNDSVDNRFLLWAIRSNAVQSMIDVRLKGTTFDEITLGQLRKVPIPHPASIDEQERIANKLDTFADQLENEKSYLESLKFLKQGLMQDLLSGTVRTTDTNIEVPDEIAQHG